MTGRRIVVLTLTIALGLASVLSFEPGKVSSMDAQQLPNNLPHPNPGGKAATFSTQVAVDLTGEFFQAQGTNGRSCASCHIAEDAWSINPGTLQDLFANVDRRGPSLRKTPGFRLHGSGAGRPRRFLKRAVGRRARRLATNRPKKHKIWIELTR